LNISDLDLELRPSWRLHSPCAFVESSAVDRGFGIIIDQDQRL